MKAVAVLICVLVAVQVQGRSFESDDNSISVPWLVHLRFSRLSLRGYLDTCVGTIINKRWVLTAASCLTARYYGETSDSPYLWVRYDSENITTPLFLTETSLSIVHPEYNDETGANDIGLVDLNREIDFTERIQPVALAAEDAELPSAGRACGYGEVDEKPGELLFCVEVTLSEADGLLVAQADVDATKYDLGAGLVADDKVYGILVRAADEESAGTFLPISKYLSWIEEVTAEEDPEDELDPVRIV